MTCLICWVAVGGAVLALAGRLVVVGSDCPIACLTSERLLAHWVRFSYRLDIVPWDIVDSVAT